MKSLQPSRPKISIIILNWNGKEDTLECLASLKKPKYTSFDVIIVDNGSSDGSAEEIKAKYPEHTLIRAGKNLGFAEGNNLGIQEAMRRGSDLLFLLNNDTIVTPSLLCEIANAYEKYPSAGAFAPKIYYYDEPATVWYAGGGVDPKTGRSYHVGCGFADKEKYKQEGETGYGCGCALAVRREVIENVGLLDPRFFLMWEEIDWCYRMKREGFSIRFVPKARLFHKVSASFPGGEEGAMRTYYKVRNRLLFHKIHSPLLKRWTRGALIRSLLSRDPASRHGAKDYLMGSFGKSRLF